MTGTVEVTGAATRTGTTSATATTAATTTPTTQSATVTLSGAALRREQGRREMRTAILDEARRLLTEEGAGALSMRAIARALGYSPAALYEYFPAKEDIFASLYFEGTGGLAGRLKAISADLPLESSIHATLHEMGRAYRNYANEQPELFRLVFGDKSRHGQSPADDTGERPGFDELVRAIERGIVSGEIDALAAEPIAVACWSIVHGFVVLEMAGHFGPSKTRVSDDPDPCGGVGRPTSDALFEMVLDRLLLGVRRR